MPATRRTVRMTKGLREQLDAYRRIAGERDVLLDEVFPRVKVTNVHADADDELLIILAVGDAISDARGAVERLKLMRAEQPTARGM